MVGPYAVFADRPRALYGSWYEFFPRSEGATVDAGDRRGHQRDPAHGRRAPRRGRRDGLRRDLPAADPPDRRGQPQGPEQHPHPRARRHRLPLGDRVEGRRARRDPPGPRRLRRLRRVRRAGERARPRGGPRPGAPGGAGPSVGDQAPGVVHHPRRRHHRLRGEPAEEVPGHLPAQLRQRLRRPLRRGAPDRPAVDEPRGADLPRRQPAHQAGGVLGAAARGDPRERPRRALPGRGVHPPGDDAGPRRRRVPPVLHVLHLAHGQVGDRAVPRRAVAPDRPPDAAELLRQHPRHPARVLAVRRTGGVQDPGGPRGDGLPDAGACTPATSSSSTSRSSPAARSTSTRRSTRSGSATGPRRRRAATRWRRTSPSSTGSAASTPRCSCCATSPSTGATTTTRWSSRRPRRAPPASPTTR